jgi:putative spermidine/putrescine transport system ATP-binding protein
MGSSNGESGASFDVIGLSKSYGATVALHPTDLRIGQGEYLVLLGPSGSGKTTLLMLLAGFVHPSAGDLLCSGRSILGLAPEKRGFGVVFQGYALFPHLSVAKNVAFPLEVRGAGRDETERAVERTLDLMKLAHLSERLPRQLSGGQQQRVALARALVFRPPLLLLDEPMSALDRKLKDELQAEMKDLHQRLGTTFVHITHDQEEALSLADRIVIMRDGRAVQTGAPQQLYHAPTTRFVADFLGKSNFLNCTAVDFSADVTTLRSGDYHFRQALGSSRPQQGRALTIAIRPERINVSQDAAQDENTVRGSIAAVFFFGQFFELRVDVPSLGMMIVRTPRQSSYQTGQPVRLSWPIDAGVALDD